MKSKLVLLVVLVLALPLAAFADSESFTSSGGTLTGDSTGFTLTGAELISIVGTDGVVTGNLGTVSFQTAQLGNANIVMGGPFMPGGTITITGNGTDGVTNGVIFTGTFDQGGTWTVTTLPDGTNQYVLSAEVTGTVTGSSATGQYMYYLNTGNTYFYGNTTSNTQISTTALSVPEPGELGMLGAGLLGLLGGIRRKLQMQA